jgi:hypothetical protein
MIKAEDYEVIPLISEALGHLLDGNQEGFIESFGLFKTKLQELELKVGALERIDTSIEDLQEMERALDLKLESAKAVLRNQKDIVATITSGDSL